MILAPTPNENDSCNLYTIVVIIIRYLTFILPLVAMYTVTDVSFQVLLL